MSDTQDTLQKFLNSIFALTQEEIQLYEEAFIHSSNNSLPNNQRLAFLGDSVLKLIIREHFYKENPDMNKGELTKICGEEKESNKNFANIAIKLGLVKYMDIENPPPDYKTNGTINAEALEALFGAIYINRGFEETRRIAEKYILINLGLIK
jgi:ribonuclease III